VRLSEFWDRMEGQFGSVYAESVAKDHVLPRLGRTAVDALKDGESPKTVWRAVCEEFEVPAARR
jgi:hypothetical protein